MAKFLPVQDTGTVAIGTCYRCRFRYQYSELTKDPNNKNWYCPDCIDIYDPWRLPARKPENISLQHPRPDGEIPNESPTIDLIATQSLFPIEFPDSIYIGITV